MALGNWDVRIHAPRVDETRLAGEAPADYVLRLAQSKAQAAAADGRSTDIIVAADTAVVDGEDVLGKPVDAVDAVRMLRRLRDRSHRVYTGIAVLKPDTGVLISEVCMTSVPMRDFADGEIDSYVASGDPMDKAGAYGIQHPGFHPVSEMTGCYASVMGLPLCHLLRLLARLGEGSRPELPGRCQEHLGYVCPVSGAILRGEPVG
jgi:septum formation protein